MYSIGIIALPCTHPSFYRAVEVSTLLGVHLADLGIFTELDKSRYFPDSQNRICKICRIRLQIEIEVRLDFSNSLSYPSIFS